MFADKCLKAMTEIKDRETKETHKASGRKTDEAHKVSGRRVNEARRAFRNYIKLPMSRDVNDTTLQDFFDNRMLVVQAIQRGIPYTLFQHIKELTPFSDKDWAEFLNLSVKSLQRYKAEKSYLFKPIYSEKIIELTEVTLFGMEVFDSSGQFYLWLNTPSYALGNMKPIELLRNSYGKDMVISELNRIDQGIFV